MREPDQRKGRQCIRPEISRTFTFGEKGTSQGQFYHQFLSKIRLNTDPIDWRKESLSYLMKVNYDAYFQSKYLREAKVIQSPEELRNFSNSTLLLYYANNKDFVSLATYFGIMSDIKVIREIWRV